MEDRITDISEALEFDQESIQTKETISEVQLYTSIA